MATQTSDISTKLIKENSNVFSEFLFEYFNIIETGNFPEQLIGRC